MKKLVLSALAAVAVVVTAGNAQAAYIGSTPASNDVIGVKEGVFGANLYLVAGAATTITIDFVGKEAGYTNTFTLNGETLINNQSTPVGTSFARLVAPGLISFRFDIPGDSVDNGSNTEPPVAPNFFISLGSVDLSNPANRLSFLGDTTVNGSTPFSGNVAILALDDGGAGPDDNHDDLVVRLSITGGTFGAPDGGTTVTLLGGALLGLGLLRRKFNV